MTKFAKLAFDLSEDLSNLNTRLPLQIRDKNMTILAAGLSDMEFTVPAGTYFVTARMPDGTQPVLAGPMEALAGEAVTRIAVEPRGALFRMDPNGGETLPRANQTRGVLEEWRKTLRVAAKPAGELATRGMMSDDGMENLREEAPLLSNSHIWRGRWLDIWLDNRNLAAGQTEPLDSNVTSLRTNLRRRTEHTLLFVEEPGEGSASFFAIPFDGPGALATRVEVSWDKVYSFKDGKPFETKRPTLTFFFQDLEISAFLRYIHRSNVLEAANFACSFVRRAIDHGMGLKTLKSWLGTVLGCYVLLRRNELDDLDECTSILLRLARHVPDVLSLRVEYLARAGRHLEAARLLADLQSFGCPWFRSGIIYLLDRSRRYSRGLDGLAMSQQLKFACYEAALTRLVDHIDPEFTTATYRHIPFNFKSK